MDQIQGAQRVRSWHVAKSVSGDSLVRITKGLVTACKGHTIMPTRMSVQGCPYPTIVEV